jgi:signal transduction histidine kinase/ABC-type uncharacterized transport system substrate-binding protein
MKPTNKIRFYLCLTVMLLSLSANYIQAQSIRHILIVDSYDGNVNWANMLIDSVISKVSLQYEKIDFTRVELKSNRNINHNDLSLSSVPVPDMVLAIGEEAKRYVSKVDNQVSIFNSIPKIMISTETNFPQGSTGVSFEIPAKENIELIRKVLTNLDEILFIDDDYEGSRAAIRLIKEEMKRQHINVPFRSIIHTDNFDDTELSTVLDNKPNRAILTYAWDFKFKNSTFNFNTIDSLLTNSITSPIFSMTNIGYNNAYVIGGYNLSIKMGSEKIIDQIIKIIKGSSITDIQPESLKNGNIILNKAAIKHFSLESTTDGFFEVEYINVPESFTGQNELLIIFITIALLIFFSLIYLSVKYIQASKEDSIKLKEYKNKYDILEKIYTKSKIYFAIYDSMGEKQFDIIGDESDENSLQVKKYLPDNLFKAQFLSNEIKDNIRSKKESNLRIKDDNSTIKIIIKPLAGNINSPFKYSISITIDHSEKDSNKRNDTYYNLIDEISQIYTLGIASYNIYTRKGHATKRWYTNMEEKENSTNENITLKYTNISTKDKAEINDFIKEVIEGKATKFQKEIQVNIIDPVNGKHKTKWINYQIILKDYYPSANNITLIEINYDITENKQRETDLEIYNDKAKEAYRYSTDFINNISHEIRTPLTSIIGFSKMLIIDQNSENKEIVNIIKRNNVLLIELINNILSLANIDSGNYVMNMSDLNLNDIFKDLRITTVHMLSTEKLLTHKNIEILIDTPNTPHTIHTDEWNFRQVMINLLSNAVKFTTSGTIIFGYQIHEESTYFYVKDTGCGIAQQNLDKIFHRFEKIDVFTAGNGLGLSLCKSIITLLGGEIGVTSKEGEGSTFWFILK